jgi:hypothetical protein
LAVADITTSCRLTGMPAGMAARGHRINRRRT